MAKSTIKSYNKRAQKYEKRWEKYLEHTHRILLEQLDIASSDLILDPSGGTGLLAQKLIQQNTGFEKFVLNDPSSQMLAVARQRLSDYPAVIFSNKQVQQLAYPNNHFDTIICLNAFHFYNNQPQVLNQFYRMLSPTGKLYILDWNRRGLFRLVNQLITWGSSEYINTRSESELSSMMTDTGFQIKKSFSWNWRYWKFLFVEGRK